MTNENIKLNFINREMQKLEYYILMDQKLLKGYQVKLKNANNDNSIKAFEQKINKIENRLEEEQFKLEMFGELKAMVKDYHETFENLANR